MQPAKGKKSQSVRFLLQGSEHNFKHFAQLRRLFIYPAKNDY